MYFCHVLLYFIETLPYHLPFYRRSYLYFIETFPYHLPFYGSLRAFCSPPSFLLSFWRGQTLSPKLHLHMFFPVRGMFFPTVFTHWFSHSSRPSRWLHPLESHSDSTSIPTKSSSGRGTGLCAGGGAVPTEYKINYVHLTLCDGPRCAYFLRIHTS